MAYLLSFSGLPGVGKTAIARALCAKTGASYLRVDSVETALKNSVLEIEDPEDAGYLALAAIAKENLMLNHNVVVDTVNPIKATRDLWSKVAQSSNATMLNVEIICSDKEEHRNRVENRIGDLENHVLPTWDEVLTRTYEPWPGEVIVLDTARERISDLVMQITGVLEQQT